MSDKVPFSHHKQFTIKITGPSYSFSHSFNSTCESQTSSLSTVCVCARARPHSRSYHIHTKSHTCTHNSSLKFITTFQITAFITKPTIQLLTVSNMRNALAAAYVVLSANKSSASRTVRFSQYNLFSFFLSIASRSYVCVANSTTILFYIIYLRSNHQIQT